MTAPGAHVYEKLRGALAKVRPRLAADEAMTLERVETILTRLIVDDRDLPAIRRRREAGGSRRNTSPHSSRRWGSSRRGRTGPISNLLTSSG